MRRNLVIVTLAVTLLSVMPLWAQAPPGASPASKIICCQSYDADGNLAGEIHITVKEGETCPAPTRPGWTVQEVPCEVSPTPVPTIPAPPPWTPTPKPVPTLVMKLINWLTSFAPTLPVFAGFVTIFGIVVGLARQLFAMFGARLSGKTFYIVSAVVTWAAMVADVVLDLKISTTEWGTVVAGTAGMVAAFFGYKLIYTDAAKARVDPGN